MKMHLIYTSEVDALGRRSFDMEWTADGRTVGQCFFAEPEGHIKRLRAAGREVVIHDLGSEKSNAARAFYERMKRKRRK